ncbi:MAG: glycoside hydrolase family 127 protein [Lachnospiraceae bacterium]|nr:glycoside hydrolase family 127 protein [Lachnospiraceae bacterium]
MRLKKIAALFTAVALATSGMVVVNPAANVHAAEIDDSLVVDLKFDNNLDDASGNGYSGTGNKDLTYVEGVSGQAVYLDGSSYIDLGKSTDLQPENLTVSMWVKADGKMAGENMLTWFKPSGRYQGKGWYLSSLDDSTPLKISIGESTGQPMEAYVSGSRSEFFPDGEWVHIAVTFDKETQTVQIFRNGVAQEVLYLNVASYISQDGESNKYIGFNSPGYNGGFAKVYLDDFRIYSQVASASDVIDLYTEYGKEFDASSVIDADYANLTLPVSVVKYDLALPTVGGAGSEITWSSTNEAALSNEGVVTRPALGEADAKVTLTATLKFGGEEKTKTFELTVPAITDFTTLEDFSKADIELIDDYLVNATKLEIEYLKSLEADRLLRGFADIADADLDAELYAGWESSDIKGHTLGHYLTAVAQAYEATGDSELLDILNYMSEKLLEYQAESGYLAAIPEAHYDRIEAGNTAGTWVPWYTMHKILAGIIDVYKVTGNEDAFTVAKRLGDWVYSRTSTWSEATQLTVLAVEYGGMNDCLYELYSITGDENHAKAAHSFDEMKLFQSLYNGDDILDGLHANTTIPKIVGALNRYITLTDSEDRDYYLQVAENFWQIVINNHTYVTGGNSEWEHFGKSQILDGERTNCNCETCNTYNMLKLSRELYKITGEAKYADFYETTFINAILSSQNPETGMTTYFQPMATGFYKVYSTPETNFWCCTGSGMESFSKLGDSLYYHNDKDIYVMQFFSSSVTWDEKNIQLTQDTDIPNVNTTTLTVKTLDGGTSDAGIKIRVPEWAVGTPTVTVNGKATEVVVAGGLISLAGPWNDGDKIVVTFDIEVVSYTLPDSDNVIAFKYGPVVLSASLGTEDMVNSTTGVSVTVPTKLITIDEDIAVVDGTVEDWVANVASNVVKAEGKMEFTLEGTDSELVFTPHYEQYTDRYGIYFYLVTADGEAADSALISSKDKNRVEASIIDEIPVSNDQYENSHSLQSQSSATGSFGGLMYRDAAQGGYFQYTMKVDGDGKNVLIAKYYSGDAGRTFSIYVDDTLLADVTIEGTDPADFYEARYEIPEELTKGKESVVVKFAADKVGYAGGIFDILKMVKAYNSNTSFDDIVVAGDSIKDKIDGDKITAYVDETLKEVSVKFDLTDDYGLLYIDGKLVDDTKEQVITLSDAETKVTVKVVAEDHETEKTYTFSLVKGEEPGGNTMTIVIIVVAVVVVAAGAFVVLKKKKSKKAN